MADDAIASGRYVCPRCGARFPTVGAKKRHLKDCQEEE